MSDISARKSIVLLVVGLMVTVMLLTACLPKVEQTYTGPTDECGPIEPSDEDLRFLLTIGQDLFSRPEWVKSYTVEPYKVSLTRRNDTQSAIAYGEYLLYNCGYGQADLDAYFSDAGFAIVFGNYDSYTQKNFCEEGGLALYEYDLVFEGAPYLARYWVKQQSDTRLLVLMLVFPEESRALLDSYATQLFPALSSCGG
ncbi:MAG: hypothetical protein Fur0043_07730 [Anaerolineales bacterium]